MTHKHGSVFDWQGEGVEGIIVNIPACCTRLEELVVIGGLKQVDVVNQDFHSEFIYNAVVCQAITYLDADGVGRGHCAFGKVAKFAARIQGNLPSDEKAKDFARQAH